MPTVIYNEYETSEPSCAYFDQTIHVSQENDQSFTGRICDPEGQINNSTLESMIVSAFDDSRGGYATGRDEWGTISGTYLTYDCSNSTIDVTFDQGYYPNNLNKYLQPDVQKTCDTDDNSKSGAVSPWAYVGLAVGGIVVLTVLATRGEAMLLACCCYFFPCFQKAPELTPEQYDAISRQLSKQLLEEYRAKTDLNIRRDLI